jgi:hypothetical protein
MATFSNISAIPCLSVLLVEETKIPGENYRPAADTLYHLTCASSTPRYERYSNTTLVVIGTDCTASCKSKYHTITTTTAPTSIFYILEKDIKLFRTSL